MTSFFHVLVIYPLDTLWTVVVIILFCFRLGLDGILRKIDLTMNRCLNRHVHVESD